MGSGLTINNMCLFFKIDLGTLGFLLIQSSTVAILPSGLDQAAACGSS